MPPKALILTVDWAKRGAKEEILLSALLPFWLKLRSVLAATARANVRMLPSPSKQQVKQDVRFAPDWLVFLAGQQEMRLSDRMERER